MNSLTFNIKTTVLDDAAALERFADFALVFLTTVFRRASRRCDCSGRSSASGFSVDLLTKAAFNSTSTLSIQSIASIRVTRLGISSFADIIESNESSTFRSTLPLLNQPITRPNSVSPSKLEPQGTTPNRKSITIIVAPTIISSAVASPTSSNDATSTSMSSPACKFVSGSQIPNLFVDSTTVKFVFLMYSICMLISRSLLHHLEIIQILDTIVMMMTLISSSMTVLRPYLIFLGPECMHQPIS